MSSNHATRMTFDEFLTIWDYSIIIEDKSIDDLLEMLTSMEMEVLQLQINGKIKMHLLTEMEMESSISMTDIFLIKQRQKCSSVYL